MRRFLAFAIVLGALGALSGCGIPVDSAAHTFNDTVPRTVCQGKLTLSVYFALQSEIGETELVPVERTYGPTQANEATCALEALNSGPVSTEQLRAPSIVTEFDVVPETLALRGPVVNHVATVSLDTTFLSIAFPAIIAAYGQIVLTLTNPGLGINKVKFVIGNSSTPYLEVLRVDQSFAPQGIVDRSDYCKLTLVSNGGCLPDPQPAAKHAKTKV